MPFIAEFVFIPADLPYPGDFQFGEKKQSFIGRALPVAEFIWGTSIFIFILQSE